MSLASIFIKSFLKDQWLILSSVTLEIIAFKPAGSNLASLKIKRQEDTTIDEIPVRPQKRTDKKQSNKQSNNQTIKQSNKHEDKKNKRSYHQQRDLEQWKFTSIWSDHWCQEKKWQKYFKYSWICRINNCVI